MLHTHCGDMGTTQDEDHGGIGGSIAVAGGGSSGGSGDMRSYLDQDVPGEPTTRSRRPFVFRSEISDIRGRVYLVAMSGLDKDDVSMRFDKKSLIIDGHRDAKRHTPYEDGGVSYWCVIPFDWEMTRGTLKNRDADSKLTEIIWVLSGHGSPHRVGFISER